MKKYSASKVNNYTMFSKDIENHLTPASACAEYLILSNLKNKKKVRLEQPISSSSKTNTNTNNKRHHFPSYNQNDVRHKSNSCKKERITLPSSTTINTKKFVPKDEATERCYKHRIVNGKCETTIDEALYAHMKNIPTNNTFVHNTIESRIALSNERTKRINKKRIFFYCDKRTKNKSLLLSTTTTTNPKEQILIQQQKPLLTIFLLLIASLVVLSSDVFVPISRLIVQAQNLDPTTINPAVGSNNNNNADSSATNSQATATCFGGLQTFEKISMSSFENPSSGSSGSSFGGGILVQQDDQALTSECVNLCRSQANCLSFVIDYNKFECKSYATTQQELQQEFDEKFHTARSINNNNNATLKNNTAGDYQQASTTHFQHLLPSSSSNYFEKICLDGIANRNQFSDVCGQGRLWTIERVVDSFLDGYVEKEVTNVNNKDECSKLCIFETQFVCRSADYDQHSRLCRLSKEDRRTQPQAMRSLAGSNRQYLENQCATPGPSSCVYETKKNLGIISMDALKFAQTVQDCQMKCNQESTFNCRSYSFHQQRCFLSGDDSSSLNTNLIKLPLKQGWNYGEKKCLVELCTKGIFSYEKITGYSLRSALTTPIDLMMPGGSSLSMSVIGNNLEDLEKLQHESSQTRLRQLLPIYNSGMTNGTSSVASTMMMMMMGKSAGGESSGDPLFASETTSRYRRSDSNLAVTNHCRHSCDLGYLNCPAFTIDYKNNRCQRLDRNSQGRHHELVPQEGFAYYEKICLRVPEIMSMCQDKYWIFERVIGYELAPRLYDKTLKFVQSRRDCKEYCLEEKQFQCRSALYNDEISECKLSRYDRRLATQEGGYYRNFNVRISYLENQCIRDHVVDKRQQCYYEQAKDEPAYPTFTEHIEMVQTPPNPATSVEMENTGRHQQASSSNSTVIAPRYGQSYCEQLCNENSKFECHSFGYYASTAQCFLSGDDTISAGESATTPSTGFSYFEKKCRLLSDLETTNNTASNVPTNQPQHETNNANPYFQPPLQNGNNNKNHLTNMTSTSDTQTSTDSASKPTAPNNNNISIHIDQQLTIPRPFSHKPTSIANDSSINPDEYKCGHGHTFVYQRISGFEPIGGYLTLLIKNNEAPGIVAECADLCKRAYECRAYVVDYNSNQCFAMLENSSTGLLSLRQTIGKDYFEGFCLADHILLSGNNCRNKTWVVDKIVDQAVIGVQHQKVISDSDRVQCRQACLEERLFWCKSALFDSSTGDCKLYSIDRESMPQMRLLFTKGVDFFENQCQIISSSCPYDAIERDMTIVTTTRSVQARSTFDCENACNTEITFNCRSYTYLEQNPSLPNLCLLSSDSRSTSQRGSVGERQRTLYAERNCYYRRPRFPGGSNLKPDSMYSSVDVGGHQADVDPYQLPESTKPNSGHSTSDAYAPTRPLGNIDQSITSDTGSTLGKQCEPHQFTFERTFGYDYKFAQKERAPINPSVGIAIACQQECLRRAERCQSFVVDYSLPFQSCFLIETQVGANKKLLIKSLNSAYFEKVCLPRLGIETESFTHSQLMANNQQDIQTLDIAPSYSNEPWAPQVPSQLPYYLQQQQLVQNYPSRSCAKLWTFERFINHNFTASSDKTLENIINKAQCETNCLNEASFNCRAATYDYTNKVCKLFKNTRRTIMSQFVDLESTSTSSVSSSLQPNTNIQLSNSQPGTALVLTGEESKTVHTVHGTISNTVSSNDEHVRAQARARQLTLSSGEPSLSSRNIDYFENTCVPEPSSCQYRQLYDLLSPFVDKINHAVSLSDCQRQCDLERLFSCKSVNYDPTSKSCMLINEDLISLNRGQQGALMPKKNMIYSEKGNCEMISVQCNSQEMLVSINFDAPFRGRLMAKGNPEQCFLIGDGQTSIQFPIVFGPKCNSRQEGHNTFVNEVVVQQHPVIMTESDKTVRVMCAFEAPDQTITLKNPSSRDNKTGIDVGTPESSRTRHDKQNFNSVVSNKAAPPSVLLRILDQNGRDASMINLGDELVLRIQMQLESQNSALGIFARNLAARSSNGESLLLIDNDGCPVDHQVFPALEVDPKDGKSLYSSFKAFRFPSSGLVNFEVQIRFCPERCQPVDCHKGQKMKSYGRRRKRQVENEETTQYARTSVIQSITPQADSKNHLEELSTVMKPGKAFEYVRKLLLAPTVTTDSSSEPSIDSTNQATTNVDNPNFNDQSITSDSKPTTNNSGVQVDQLSGTYEESVSVPPSTSLGDGNSEMLPNDQAKNEFFVNDDGFNTSDPRSKFVQNETPTNQEASTQTSIPFQKSILMHVDEKVVPSTSFINPQSINQAHASAPYGTFLYPEMEMNDKHETSISESNIKASTVTENSANLSTNPSTAESTTDTTQNEFSSSSTNKTDLASFTDHSTTESLIDSAVTYGSNDSTMRSSDILDQHKLEPKSFQTNAKDVPLRFSILVGENQLTNSGGWTPGGAPPVLVMNSTKVDLDHIVIPGEDGRLNSHSADGGLVKSRSNSKQTTTAASSSVFNEGVDQNVIESRPSLRSNSEATKRSTLYDQTFDALSSNSITAEVKMNHPSTVQDDVLELKKTRNLLNAKPESAASHDCQLEAGNTRLWTIIWTGTIVIVLNICLVVLSLVLYFKKVHLRQQHNIMLATSECGTHSSRSGLRWPSVLLKSKNNLGTSLNTHEHFFCKLNSKPSGSSRAGGHEFNWPNLSSSSSHSTISSMGSPLPVTNTRMNQSRLSKLPFDTQSSLRNNFLTGHKSVLEGSTYEFGNNNNNIIHASYTNNIDESHTNEFQ